MTWEIFVGLTVVLSFTVTIGTLIYKLSKTLTVLEAAVKALTEFKSDSKTEHKEMHDKIEDHETRIVTLEIKANVPKK